MSAVNWRENGRRGASASTLFGVTLPLDRFVLPRFLRRPVRMIAHLGKGNFRAPRFSVTILSVGLLASSGAYGAYLGGHVESIVQGVTARTGFAVDQIKVAGNHETSEIDILGSLELDGWTSLIGFNVEAARERISTLPWVELATVRKVYPNTLEVRVEERQAYALWQQGGTVSVIERSGRMIAPYSGGKQRLLPLLIGDNAPAHAPELLARIDRFPELGDQVRAYVRVSGRRWDLKLQNGITVKLPEVGEDEAIATLARLDRENGLLARDIAAVDMRLAGRMVVQLTPQAQTARQAMLKAQPKIAKRKAEARI